MEMISGQFKVIVVLVALSAAMLESFIAQQRQAAPMRWREARTSLWVALGQQVSKALSAGAVLAVLDAAAAHRLTTLRIDGTTDAFCLFITAEFFYYWQHRLSHEVRWFWATHAVHHSPTLFNFSGAYRLGWTSGVSGVVVFLLPMVWIGFSVRDILTVYGLGLLYQFWLHTTLVPRLGWFDLIFNSPSNHRVHHAVNDAYLDRNFGGVLMVFDHLFGTYVREAEAVVIVYGLKGHTPSFNPLHVALGEWLSLGHDLRGATSWRQRVQLLVRKPR